MSEPTPTGDVTHDGSVSPERFARVRAIFEAALERPPAERRAFAAGACVGDPALLRDVEAMLAADAHTDPLLPREHSSSSSAPEEGRFPAGSTLADRYRILGLLGRGGMGEVYRAFDLRLNQTVALKFLPEATARHASLLDRFRGEVRIARQISHRNVCRVYDLGDLDGMPFLSMEYVDGEDLRSLLRRIGRLPGDKAIEIARKLCAGLAAAHEKGVLHRDLKPANIMIDGQGQVRIMDFGLAAAVDAIGDGDIRSGTPAYMAPEQLEGREVTVRSDLYALGLVLYELFTGQQVYEGPERPSAPAPATSVVKDIDPRVETAIERCLDPNPARRPASALALARMLPGGDPLAEALAAGDTPTPAMVAASEEMGALPVRWAVACLVTVIVSLAVSVVWSNRNNVINLTPMPYSQEVLANGVQKLVASLGYPDPALDRTFRFDSTNYVGWAARNLTPEAYRAQLAQGQPAPFVLTYHQSPAYLVSDYTDAVGLFGDTRRIPGTVSLQVDPRGCLVRWRSSPASPGQAPTPPRPTRDWTDRYNPAAALSTGPEPAEPPAETNPPPPPAMDWRMLFSAACLDDAQWIEAEPALPDVPFDQRASWTGSYAGAPEIPLRIDTAAWQGRLTSFEITSPWSTPPAITDPRQMRDVFQTFLLVLLFVAAGWLGLRNLRTGRGDRTGATRLAGALFVCAFLSGVLLAHHTPTLQEVTLLSRVLGSSLVLSVFAGLMYLALEPYVRRHWPQVLISWTRLLSGDVLNPVVAGHALVGLAAAAALTMLGHVVVHAVDFPIGPGAEMLTARTLIGAGWFGGIAIPTTMALSLAFILLLARVLLRRTWLAVVAVLLVVAVPAVLQQIDLGSTWFMAFGVGQALLRGFVTVLILTRFGVLAATLAITQVVWSFPFTTNLSAWYATPGLLQIALTLALAIWAFRYALGGRRVWQRSLLDG